MSDEKNDFGVFGNQQTWEHMHRLNDLYLKYQVHGNKLGHIPQV